MLNLPITNPMLQRMLLEHLVERIENDPGCIDELLQQGVDPAFLDHIRHCKTRDLIAVAPTLKNMFYSFSPPDVMWGMDRVERKRCDDKRLEYFVLNGASRTILCDLFKLTAEEVRRLRNLLLGGAQVGRARLPRVAIRDEIHRAWYTISKDPTPSHPRERAYRLHQQFPDLRIDSMEITLREFGETMLQCDPQSVVTAH
ncbi:DUF2857 domain-containing protein [Variovorax sp. ZS18.2.2]|uniref:DUF2857 domain-containing protein n=1 Tax=Variovorax sp. ZS18.2.2 TaxID=2971255 RepID=UPI002150CDC4|nr:DUF2857 domain-containing protein [Variovorax sp. ZS18.2.2]MCR6480967.1 DUF2857 domain-containing protein [Variovorax sp. ZS18.2.2]